MRAFAELYARLDETTKTNDKIAGLADYFASTPPADSAWAVYFLTGRKPRQVVGSRKLRDWAAEEAGLPSWLFDECYDAVGDLSETIALLLPPPAKSLDMPLAKLVEDVLLPLRSLDEAAQKQTLLEVWRGMDQNQRFVWNKLISGAFRVGVSAQLVVKALSKVSGVESAILTHRLMGDWKPTIESFQRLLTSEAHDAENSKPYPFSLAYPLEAPPESLGDRREWQAEWKWDGIRSQVIQRGGEVAIWTRGEELVTDRYPELASMAQRLPAGTVIDGEILPWKDGSPLPFAQLQRRIGRKTVGKALLRDVPVVLIAYDLLEHDGEDLRPLPLDQRRSMLERVVDLVQRPTLMLSPILASSTWEGLATDRLRCREMSSEGLMLKRLESPYRVGRQKGDWWKWKINPFTIDAVLTAAQRGSGKRASLYTDYTFSLWDQDKLVPIAKAYSGLTDEEIRRVDQFIRKNMVEKFGPVRTVKPELVFEIAFEGIQRSTRHKSGVAVRFPRILRWRDDKPATDADTLDTLRAMLPNVPVSSSNDENELPFLP